MGKKEHLKPQIETRFTRFPSVELLAVVLLRNADYTDYKKAANFGGLWCKLRLPAGFSQPVSYPPQCFIRRRADLAFVLGEDGVKLVAKLGNPTDRSFGAATSLKKGGFLPRPPY